MAPIAYRPAACGVMQQPKTAGGEPPQHLWEMRLHSNNLNSGQEGGCFNCRGLREVIYSPSSVPGGSHLHLGFMLA